MGICGTERSCQGCLLWAGWDASLEALREGELLGKAAEALHESGHRSLSIPAARTVIRANGIRPYTRVTEGLQLAVWHHADNGFEPIPTN